MLNRLSIRARLVGIAILFLVPIALQVYLFVDQSRKDITFSDKEVSGLSYLRGAWPVLHALAAAINDPAQPAAKLQSAPKLEAAAKTYDGEMGSEQASRELAKTLAGLGWRASRSRPATRPMPRSRPRARWSTRSATPPT